MHTDASIKGITETCQQISLDVTNSWSHICAPYASPSNTSTPSPPPPLVKLQTTPLGLTSTLYSEQIEVLFYCLVNILHKISYIYTTAKTPVATTTTTNNYSICCWFFFQSLAIWSSLKLGMLASSSGKM